MGLFDGSATTSQSYSPEVTNFVNQTLAQANNYTNGMTPANSVAGFTDDQNNAFQMARGAVGGYAPYLSSAKNLFTSSGGRGQQAIDSFSGSREGLQNWSALGYQDLSAGMPGITTRLNAATAPVDSSAVDYSRYGTDAYGAAGRSYGLIDSAASTADLALNRADVTGVNAGSVGGTDLSAYLDPYAQGVLGTTIDEINRNAGRDANAARLRAAGSGGSGGAGEALLQSEISRGASDARSRASASIMSDAFKQAQATAAADLDRRLSADTTTAQAKNTEALQRRQNALEVASTKGALAGQNTAAASAQGVIAKNLSDTAQSDAQRRTATELALRENQLKAAGIDLDALKAKAAAGDAAAGRMIDIAQTLLGAQTSAAGIEATAGAGMAGLGQTSQQLSANDIAMLLGIGGQQQQQQQQVLNVPREALNMRLATVQGQPLNTTGTAPGGNTLANYVGAGASALGAARWLFG